MTDPPITSIDPGFAYPVPEAATFLSQDPKHLRRLIKAGRIKAVDISLRPGTGRPTWRISGAEILRFSTGGERSGSENQTTKRRRRRPREVKEFV